MGVTEERPSVLSQEQFEELAHLGNRVDESLRLEFINGRIGEKAVPDGVHGRIIVWLTQFCVQALPGMWLFGEQGIRVETYRKGNARPDGLLAPIDHFVEQGEWASPEGVLMVVEVTSTDSDTTSRDRVDKPRAYAESGIPVYLLIDRGTHEVKVHSLPDGVRYESMLTVPFGKTVPLPDPVGFDLDTEPLKSWVH
ncbi:Uma2 family endonuclease [Streptomyces uncialis]|uniref:Uma2 family endonuclease n=1 Tax=Streptomyces uncialis TaxID=1048205 RepID=UPI002E34DB0D|nr:Uma2 family endonuclease [Streptomyces uncialis]WST69247.1 Uma2 family endonuclease [Streptomyces uncialis]